MLVLRDYVSWGSRSQAGIKYVRILLGGTVCEIKGGGSLTGLEEPSVHEARLNLGEEWEEKVDESVLSCHSPRRVLQDC